MSTSKQPKQPKQPKQEMATLDAAAMQRAADRAKRRAAILAQAAQATQATQATPTQKATSHAADRAKRRTPQQPIVRVRGLPYETTPPEVASFFQTDVGNVRFVPWVSERKRKKLGPCSGECFLVLPSQTALSLVLGKHRVTFGRRYVECFRSTLEEMDAALREPSDASSHIVSSTDGATANSQQLEHNVKLRDPASPLRSPAKTNEDAKDGAAKDGAVKDGARGSFSSSTTNAPARQEEGMLPSGVRWTRSRRSPSPGSERPVTHAPRSPVGSFGDRRSQRREDRSRSPMRHAQNNWRNTSETWLADGRGSGGLGSSDGFAGPGGFGGPGGRRSTTGFVTTETLVGVGWRCDPVLFMEGLPSACTDRWIVEWFRASRAPAPLRLHLDVGRGTAFVEFADSRESEYAWRDVQLPPGVRIRRSDRRELSDAIPTPSSSPTIPTSVPISPFSGFASPTLASLAGFVAPHPPLVGTSSLLSELLKPPLPPNPYDPRLRLCLLPSTQLQAAHGGEKNPPRAAPIFPPPQTTAPAQPPNALVGSSELLQQSLSQLLAAFKSNPT